MLRKIVLYILVKRDILEFANISEILGTVNLQLTVNLNIESKKTYQKIVRKLKNWRRK